MGAVGPRSRCQWQIEDSQGPGVIWPLVMPWEDLSKISYWANVDRAVTSNLPGQCQTRFHSSWFWCRLGGGGAYQVSCWPIRALFWQWHQGHQIQVKLKSHLSPSTLTAGFHPLTMGHSRSSGYQECLTKKGALLWHILPSLLFLNEVFQGRASSKYTGK